MTLHRGEIYDTTGKNLLVVASESEAEVYMAIVEVFERLRTTRYAICVYIDRKFRSKHVFVR